MELLLLFRMCLYVGSGACREACMQDAGDKRVAGDCGCGVVLIRSTVCVRLCGMRASADCRSGLRLWGGAECVHVPESSLGSTLQHGGLHVTQQGHWRRWCSGASARTRSVCLSSLRRWCVETQNTAPGPRGCVCSGTGRVGGTTSFDAMGEQGASVRVFDAKLPSVVGIGPFTRGRGGQLA